MTELTPDLPAAVAASLESSIQDPGIRSTVIAAGVPFSAIEWGDAGARPLLLEDA